MILERPLSAKRLSDVASQASEHDSLCLKDVEKEAVILALKKCNGKKGKAAKVLGIDRKTLHRKEKKYGLNN